MQRRLLTETPLGSPECASYRRLVEVLPNALFIHNLEKVTYCNPAFMRLMGATDPNQIYGRYPLEFFAPRFQPEISRRIECLTHDQPVAPFENALVTVSGREVPVQTVGTLLNHNGEKSILVVIFDLSELKRTEQELRRSTELLSAVVNNATDAIFVKDTEGRYLLFNNAAAQCVGRSVYEVLGRNDAALFDPDSATAIMARDRQIIATGVPSTVEERVSIGGTERVYSATKVPYFDKIGEVIGLVGISRDITQRKQAEDELLNQQKLLNMALHAAKAAIWWLDINSGEFYSSPEAVVMHDLPSDVTVTLEMALSGYHPDHRQQAVDLLNQLMKTPQPANMDYRVNTLDGSERWHNVCVDVVHLESGPRLVGLIQDITERKRAERLLEQRRTHLESVINSSMDGIITIDETQRIVVFNAAAEQMFCCAAVDVLGTPIEQFIPDRFRPGHADRVERFGETGVAPMGRYGVVTARRANGDEFPMESSIARIGSPGNRLYTITCRDVTDRIQAEKQRELLEHELRQSQKMEAIGRLAGGVAHDFNNLLTIICGYADLSSDMVDANHEARPLLTAIKDAGDRAAALTRQLLTFSRKNVVEPQVVDLSKVLSGTQQMLQRLIGEDIRVELELTPQLWPTRLDPNQFNQVLMNLAVNSRDAMPQGGTLRMQTLNADFTNRLFLKPAELTEDKYVVVKFSDSGTGIPADVMSRIFEPFFTTKEVGKGTGLGLAVVHGIVKQCGGHIAVQSHVGVGTTFTLYFPAWEVIAPPELDTVTAAPRGGNELLLMVEDEPGVRDLTAWILRAAGYEVLVADSAAQALEICLTRHDEIQLVVTDVVMPEMDGWHLAQEFTRRGYDFEVIFVSGYAGDEMARNGDLPANANFLAKPFSPAKLTTLVRSLLDARAKNSGAGQLAGGATCPVA